MNRLHQKLISLTLTLSLVLVPLMSSAVAQTPSNPTPSQHYRMIDLTPSGATNASVAGMSATQQVGTAGFSPAQGLAENHAVVWSGSSDSAIDLGPGTAYGTADGQQVGQAFDHAMLWTGSADSRVDLNPGIWLRSIANGVAAGQQVGQATRYQPCVERRGTCPSSGTYIVFHPMMWSGSADSAVDLTPFNLGLQAGQALGTDGVQQVGYGQQMVGYNAFTAPVAVVWSGTADSAVNLNPPNSNESQAKAVANGQQVGYAFSLRHAVLWTGTAASVRDLNPTGFASSEANATNGLQQAGVGFVSIGPNIPMQSHALVWSGTAESAIDLNQFMPLGFTESAATGIDAAGNVVGWAATGSRANPANVHAVMWIPTESTGSFVQSATLTENPINAGESAEVTVTLSDVAPAGGALINLASSLFPPFGGTPSGLTVDMPASVTVAEGQVSASFTVSTQLVSVAGYTRPYVVDIQASYGDTTQTAILAVNPPVTLSTLSIAPGNVVSGSTATGTVTLNSAAPAGGASVTLSSNNAAASVPATVVVPAGQTTTTFTVQTNSVTTFTTATITGSYGSAIPVSASASLLVSPPPVSIDTVSIQKADYVVSKRQLTVQATSSSATATLTVTVTATGEVIGFLRNKGAGSYAETFSLASAPQNITVTSNLSGVANRVVNVK